MIPPASKTESGAFRAGDWVEVRSLSEILSTLDGKGRLEGLPFMMEMVPYCGKRFRIVKSAHKTCDPTGLTNMRSMPGAVHLETRCNGSAHGGCEARCLLFWKTAWLKPVGGPSDQPQTQPVATLPDHWQTKLQAGARSAGTDAGGTRYWCQATEIVRATQNLSPAAPAQYLADVASRNISAGGFFRHLAAAYGNAALRRLRDQPRPPVPPHPLPAAASDCSEATQPKFRAGDLVRVRGAKDIIATLDIQWKHRGLTFEREMLRHCGRTYRVLGRVGRIIDERTGRMLRLAQDCVVLDGVICTGLENRARLFCPRSPLYYWRDAWLERVAQFSEVEKRISCAAE